MSSWSWPVSLDILHHVMFPHWPLRLERHEKAASNNRHSLRRQVSLGSPKPGNTSEQTILEADG